MVDAPWLGVAEVFGTAVPDGEGVAVTSLLGLGDAEAEGVGSVAQAAGASGVHNGRRVNAALAPKAATLRMRRVAPRSEPTEARTPNTRDTRDAQAKDGAKDQPVRGIPRRRSEWNIKTPQAEPRREPPSVHGASAHAYSWDRAIPSRMSCSLTVTESTAPSVISFRRVRMRA